MEFMTDTNSARTLSSNYLSANVFLQSILDSSDLRTEAALYLKHSVVDFDSSQVLQTSNVADLVSGKYTL